MGWVPPATFPFSCISVSGTTFTYHRGRDSGVISVKFSSTSHIQPAPKSHQSDPWLFVLLSSLTAMSRAWPLFPCTDGPVILRHTWSLEGGPAFPHLLRERLHTRAWAPQPPLCPPVHLGDSSSAHKPPAASALPLPPDTYSSSLLCVCVTPSRSSFQLCFKAFHFTHLSPPFSIFAQTDT